MSRIATSKYGFWLAGSYEDFIGSKVIADDENQPSTAGTYDANSTHHGNTLNGEATLNPRYRWSVRDRANNSEFSNSSNYLASNDGIFRWATLDSNRLGRGEKWAGRAQNQYPSTLVNANRLRYAKPQNNNSDDSYMLMTSSYDSANRYYIPSGDTDASFGRSTKYEWNGRNWFKMQSGKSTATVPHFMQYAHLTGCWMGERIQPNAYNGTTGAAVSAHEQNPEVIFKPIKSNAGKPFLCVTTYQAVSGDNQLNNVTNSGAYRPVIASSSNLNSKSDNDYFTIRMCSQAMLGFAGTVNELALQSSTPITYELKVGFPTSTTFGTTGSGGGTAAIFWTFTPTTGAGLSGNENIYHVDWLANQEVGDTEDPWYDLEFKLDYTNNKFKVYHEGIEVTATNTSAGSYSSGYTMANNTDTSAAFKATELTGWEMFVKPTSTAGNSVVVATMIDRWALMRPLTDYDADMSPVSSWSCSAMTNGISNAGITILDDETEQNLTPWFLSDDITDWKLLMFNDNINRPLWCGVIESVSVQQDANSRTREISITARDSLSILDRQISSWELGQIGLGTSDQVISRTEEIALLSDSMYMGVSRLEDSTEQIGFDKTEYAELEGQRMRLNSAHPIQMYNNEDEYGPNDVEKDWYGYEIAGINQYTTGGANYTEVILAHTGTSYTTSSRPDLIGMVSHNKEDVVITAVNSASGTITNFGQRLTIQSLTYTANTSATLQGVSTLSPLTGQHSGYFFFEFASRPARGDGTHLEVADYITIPDTETGIGTGVKGKIHTVIATQVVAGKFFAKVKTAASSFTSTGLNLKYTIEKGKITDTTENLIHRDAHAVWMRQLADSAWFQRHFGVYGKDFVDGGTTQEIFTANATHIKVSSSFIDSSPQVGVGQIKTSSGFYDTFSYTGHLSPAADGNHYLTGVQGLSIDHASGENMYTLSISEDYKHIWLMWADMRNNGDANADGGFRKKSFGLLKPVPENYEVSISFTDQLTDTGEYDSFTSLKIGQDLDIWDIDSTLDPTTLAPWSRPIDDTLTRQSANNGAGNCITSVSSGTKIDLRTVGGTSVANLTAGDFIVIFNSVNYSGMHEIDSISSSTITLKTAYTTVEPFVVTNNTFKKLGKVDSRLNEICDWNDTAGSLLVYDCSKFFNLNTFINGGKVGQSSGGSVSVGDYETEYHGFPILMDNYWAQAASTNINNAAPYGTHPNFRRWVNASAELNRTIEVGDKVIETKPSTSLIEDFPTEGYGKIKATRGAETNNPSFDVFWYTYDGKLSTGVIESATSANSASPIVITCSGADFVNDGVEAGMRVRNVTAKWVAQIASVTATAITISGTPYQETGSTRADVASSDSISIPQQLYGVYLQSDAASDYNADQAIALLEGIQMDEVIKSNGSTATIQVNLPSQTNQSGAYDEVIVMGTVAPRFALRFLMKVDGYAVSPNNGTYWINDKIRYLWAFNLSKTWLAQSSVSCWYDIGSIPMYQNMTVDGTDTNFDSFGGIYDGRGGKSTFSILRESTEASGLGYDYGKRIPVTYQMGRDNKLEIRPTYNTGEVVNRDIMRVNSLNASMAQQITNVRVYYNNGGSFSDFPAPTLNQTYRWKIVEQPEIRSEVEANLVAQEQYYKAKTKSIALNGTLNREVDKEDTMLDGGRYGYIADPTRQSERAVTGRFAFGSAYPVSTAAHNQMWSGLNGTLSQGQCNALDGNLGTTDTDLLKRNRYGKGYIAPASTAADATHTYANSSWWWGAHSLSHAVQIVHIPTNMPVTGMTTADDLRIWVALKDGQSGVDIENAEFTIGITDPSFSKSIVPFTVVDGTQHAYAPTLANTAGSSTFTTKNVKRNGFYEIAIPASYWTNQSGSPKITISVNVEYLKSLLYHRCGDPTASGILHNAHNIGEAGPSNWSATSADSIFPLGLRKYDKMSGLFSARNVYYCPRIHVVPDLRYRPATTLAFTDAGLGLNAEPMVIETVRWNVSGRDIEEVNLSLERDQTKDRGGLASYLYPSISRGRGQSAESGTVGGGGATGQPETKPPPRPTHDRPVGKSGVAPVQQQGGMTPNEGGGAFASSITGNQLASGLHGKISGRMNFNDNGVSGSSLSVLGQTRVAPPINTQRATEGIGSTVQATSGGTVTSNDGMTFTGLANPDSTARPSQTQTISVSVPDDVADEIISVTCTYTLGGAAGTQAVLFTEATVQPSGTNSISTTTAVSVTTDRREITLIGSTPLTGANGKNNTIEIELKRVPGAGTDTGLYSSLTIHNISVNFQRFSLKGLNTQGLGFTPY
tara:strand:+ start:9038 stop:15859 length:6822 start_codon:yes stop_codon:yes gene_type:complete